MKHALIVEDERWLADIWRRQLEAENFSVAIAKNGHEAIDACDEQLPDVVLLDMVLSGPNGIALLQEMRSHYDLATIPAAIISSVENLKLSAFAHYGVTQILSKATMQPQDVVVAAQKATK